MRHAFPSSLASLWVSSSLPSLPFRSCPLSLHPGLGLGAPLWLSAASPSLIGLMACTTRHVCWSCSKKPGQLCRGTSETLFLAAGARIKVHRDRFLVYTTVCHALGAETVRVSLPSRYLLSVHVEVYTERRSCRRLRLAFRQPIVMKIAET